MKKLSILLLVALFLGCGGGGGGGGEGDTLPGDTPPGGSGAPLVTPSAATSISSNGATLNGSVTPNGLATDVWFDIGTSPTLATYSSMPKYAVGSGTTALTRWQNVINCASGTTYYFRICASNAQGTTNSSITSFTTNSAIPPPMGAPTVTTTPASLVWAYRATLKGNVNPNGLPTTAYFEWGISPTLDGASRTPDQAVGSATYSNLVFEDLSSLTPPSTIYYFRVVATNSAGTSKGAILPFPIPDGSDSSPTILFPKAQSVTATSVELNCYANSTIPYLVYFEYAKDPSFVGAMKTEVQGYNPTHDFYFPISGLTPATYYYYRAVAFNEAGTTYEPPDPIQVVNGDIKVPRFQTAVAAGWPEAGATVGINITSTSITLRSLIISAHEPVNVYFEIDTDFNFANATRTPTQTVSTTSGTLVSANVTGLSPATLYFHRAVASNSTGTSTGLIFGSTTLP